jgi:hypothetical protein
MAETRILLGVPHAMTQEEFRVMPEGPPDYVRTTAVEAGQACQPEAFPGLESAVQALFVDQAVGL